MVQEEEIDLKQYFQILKKQKKIILGIFLMFFCATLTVNLILPKTYTASGKIFINRKKMELKLEPKFQTYSEEDISFDTYVDLIKNRELLIEVIKELNLNITSKNLNDMITVNNSHGANKVDILEVIVDANDPNLAKNIVNTILKKYVEFFQKLYTSNPRESKIYIEKQAEKTKQELEIEEEKLEKFNKTNSIDLVKNQLKSNLEELSIREKELTNTRLEKEQLEYKLTQLKNEDKEKKYYLSSPLLELNSLYQEFQRKLINLEINLAEIKQSYSDKHPKYQEILVTVNKTKEKIQELIQSVIDNNDFKFNDLVAREKGLKQDIIKLKENILQFQGRTAELEINLKRLQRNQELTSQSYTMLTTKMEEVKIEDKVQPALMRIIENAEKPDRPTNPKILRNTAMISILGLFAGIFIAFLKEYFEN